MHAPGSNGDSRCRDSPPTTGEQLRFSSRSCTVKPDWGRGHRGILPSFQHTRMWVYVRRIATLTCLVALALPGIALGQGSSTCQAYNPQLVSSLGCAGKTSPTSPNVVKRKPGTPGSVTTMTSPPPTLASMKLVSLASHSNTLPFTGLDMVLLAAGGLTLLGAGLMMRRLSASAKK